MLQDMKRVLPVVKRMTRINSLYQDLYKTVYNIPIYTADIKENYRRLNMLIKQISKMANDKRAPDISLRIKTVPVSVYKLRDEIKSQLRKKDKTKINWYIIEKHANVALKDIEKHHYETLKSLQYELMDRLG